MHHGFSFHLLNENRERHLFVAEFAIEQISKEIAYMAVINPIAFYNFLEFFKLDFSRAIVIYLVDHRLYLHDCVCKPKRDKGINKLFDAYCARPINIECVKDRP